MRQYSGRDRIFEESVFHRDRDSIDISIASTQDDPKYIVSTPAIPIQEP
ncbi:MAG: hypothetical protein SWY16_05330 [Cyanobacteriota bacterium]|nr:hypothetical protein [Cyanobacteriota bacterium]